MGRLWGRKRNSGRLAASEPESGDLPPEELVAGRPGRQLDLVEQLREEQLVEQELGRTGEVGDRWLVRPRSSFRRWMVELWRFG